MDGCRAGSDLRLQVSSCGVRDALQKRAKKIGVGIEQRFRGRESILAMAFDHVTRQRPRRCREAQHGNIRTQLPGEHANRFHQEAGFPLRIEYSKLTDLRGGSKRRLDDRAFIGKFERQSHRAGGYQDVGKNDDRVHAQNAVRLQGNLDGQFGSPANLQKIVL